MAKCKMPEYVWPISLLEDFDIPAEKINFLNIWALDTEKTNEMLHDLSLKHELLEATCAKQERYIAELEKQLCLLQKTLDLIDRNGGGANG